MVNRLEIKALIELLTSLDAVVLVYARLAVQPAAAALVEREGRVYQCSVMFDEVPDAVVLIRGLLAACESELDAALRRVAFLLEADHRVHEDRRHGLVVRRTARVKVAALFDEREGIAAPVLPLGFDHVEMRQQHHGLQTRIRPWQQRDQVPIPWLIERRDEIEIVFRVTGLHEMRL